MRVQGHYTVCPKWPVTVPDAWGMQTFIFKVFYFEFLKKKKKINKTKTAGKTDGPRPQDRPGVQGMGRPTCRTLWGLQNTVEGGPEASGHVGFEGGEASRLKKYIYCTHLTPHLEGHLIHLASSWTCSFPASSLAWPRAHAGHHLLLREGKLKSPVPIHTGQRSEAWRW